MSQSTDVEHTERWNAAHENNDEYADKQIGVLAAEAGRSVADWTLWVGILGIALVAYLAGLDNNTMWAWQTAATSSFNDYPAYTAIGIVQAVLIAVGKLPIAKIADVFGRAQAYALSVTLWMVGFVVIAVSQSTRDVAGGTVIYALGNTAVHIMQQIVVADYISTKWRGVCIGMVSLPYVINFWASAQIYPKITAVNWRWGPGLFSICAPVAAFPIILALSINQRRAKAKALIPVHPYKTIPVFTAFYSFLIDIDAVGLLLFCSGVLLFLLPINLAKLQTHGWSTDWIIAMLVLGGVMMIGFCIWEKFASKPILNRRWRLNKEVHLATMIGFFDFFSFYCSWLPTYTWSIIVMDYDNTRATYFSNCQSLALTVFGIMAGFISLGTKNYKWVMVSGGMIRMLGIGLMLKYREFGSTNIQAILPQILQGLGGGFLAITLQVSAQVNVKHQDVATVTAYFLLLTELGGACANCVVGSIQTNLLPTYYDKYLPMLNSTQRTQIYSNPFIVSSLYPIPSQQRLGIITAYNEYVRVLLVIAIVLSVPPVLFALVVGDNTLNDAQNCVGNQLVPTSRLDVHTHALRVEQRPNK